MFHVPISASCLGREVAGAGDIMLLRVAQSYCREQASLKVFTLLTIGLFAEYTIHTSVRPGTI